MTTTERAPAAPTTQGGRLRSRLLVVAGAVAAAVAIWVIAVPVLGVDLVAPPGPDETAPQAVPFVAVVMASLIASLAGWALLAVLERFLSRARTVWTVVASIVLVLSLAGPLLGDAGVPVACRITLALMHLSVGAVLITQLSKSSAAR
jgi:lysylphosphatidylglycerol synthetase-like protein (DUF2156 family)